MILFQGLEDKIVSPNQAEMMVAALRAKGLPVAYVPFEGEQHGFRGAHYHDHRHRGQPARRWAAGRARSRTARVDQLRGA